MRGEERFVMCEVYAGGILMLLMDARSIGWLGMLMGLRKRRHHSAIFGTLAAVLVPPWVAIFLFIFVASHGRGIQSGEMIVLILFYFAGTTVLNACLTAWAQQSIASEFREINTPLPTLAPRMMNDPTTPVAADVRRRIL